MTTKKKRLLDEIPTSILFNVCNFLGMKDLKSLAMCCNELNKLVDDCRAILNGESKGDSPKEQYLYISTKRIEKETLIQNAVDLFNTDNFDGCMELLVKNNLVNLSNPKSVADFLLRSSRAKKISRTNLGVFF